MARREASAVGAAALVALAWLIAAPPVADLAAHEYRAWLWDAEGFTVWNAQWYGGHHVPGYSLLFPPLAGVAGARPAVALAGVASAWALVALARDAAPDRQVVAWLAVAGAAANLVAGRGPFALGVAFAALALLLARRGQAVPAAAAALAAVWSSPVAGLFVALIGAGWALSMAGSRPNALTRRLAAIIGVSRQVRRAVVARVAPPIAIAAAAVAGGMTVALLFPEGGEERFVATAFWPMLAISIAAHRLLPQGAPRVIAAAYIVLLVLAFLIPSPVGQNALRLGVLGGPALLAAAATGPRAAVVAIGALLLYLQWLPAVRAVVEASGDPAAEAGFHRPLLDFLERAAAPGDRVEVVFTRNHWEAVHVAKRFALARGWERQLDLKVNRLFYDGDLTPERYERWLRHQRIRWVALPAAPLDFSARDEARVVRSRPRFLRPALRASGWQVFEVRGVPPATEITAAGPSWLRVRAPATLPGRRHTRYFGGCTRESPDGWLEVERPATVRARLLASDCR